MRHDLLDAFLSSTSPEDRRRDLLLCSVGAFGLALFGGALAAWLLLGGLGDGGEAYLEGQRQRRWRYRHQHDPEAEAAYWLTVAGAVIALGSLILALLGLYTLAAALVRR